METCLHKPNLNQLSWLVPLNLCQEGNPTNDPYLLHLLEAHPHLLNVLLLIPSPQLATPLLRVSSQIVVPSYIVHLIHHLVIDLFHQTLGVQEPLKTSHPNTDHQHM